MNFESINAVYEYAYVCRDASMYACTCLMNEFGEPFQTIINLFLSYMGDTLRFFQTDTDSFQKVLALRLYPKGHHPGIEEKNNTELLQSETNSFLPQYTSLLLKVYCSKEIHLQFFFYITVAMPLRALSCFHILFSTCPAVQPQ